MFNDLPSIFGSKTKAQEILLLLNDAKAVVRQGFYETELAMVEKFCEEHKLFLVKSRFKVLLEEPSYSNKGLRVPLNDPRPGMLFVYLSKEESAAWLAAYYELIEDHYNLGLLLGYPECCVRYFLQNFSPEKTNLVLSPTNIYTDLTKRDQDLVLISHFPCSSDCKASIELGKKYLEVIEREDKERGTELKEKQKIN